MSITLRIVGPCLTAQKSVSALPRVSDEIILGGERYTVTSISFDLDYNIIWASVDRTKPTKCAESEKQC